MEKRILVNQSNKNEYQYYRCKSIIEGLRDKVLAHPRFGEFICKPLYVSIRSSRNNNAYLTVYVPKRHNALSVMWFAGSKRQPRGFRLFYPFATEDCKKRDFRIHYDPSQRARPLIDSLTSEVASYIVSPLSFTEPESFLFAYFNNKPEANND